VHLISHFGIQGLPGIALLLLPHFGLEGIAGTVVYVGAIVAFVLSVLWKPQAGLYYLIPLLPLQTVRYRVHGFFWGEHLVYILALGVIIGALVRGKRQGLPKNPMNGFLCCWIALCYIALWRGSFFLGVDLPLSLSNVRFDNFLNYMLMPFLFFLVVTLVRDVKQMKILLLLMCFSLLIVNRSFYNTVGSRDLSHFSYDVRYAGELGYAGENGLGAFEAQMALFLLALYAFTKNRKVKLVLVGLLITCVYCILFVFSRGAYAATLVGMVFFGLFRERKLLLLALALLISWEVLLPTAVQQRITMTYSKEEGLDNSSAERIELWQGALKMIARNPVFGSGFDSYEFLTATTQELHDTHNYYLKVWVEMGTIGLMMFIWLLFKAFNLGYTLFRRAKDQFLKGLGLGFATLMVAAIVLNFFGDRWSYLQVDAYLWIIMAFVARGLVMVRESKAAEEAPAAVPSLASVNQRVLPA
jgi:putative inorganic carbon (HCO3(-)) transporter